MFYGDAITSEGNQEQEVYDGCSGRTAEFAVDGRAGTAIVVADASVAWNPDKRNVYPTPLLTLKG